MLICGSGSGRNEATSADELADSTELNEVRVQQEAADVPRGEERGPLVLRLTISLNSVLWRQSDFLRHDLARLVLSNRLEMRILVMGVTSQIRDRA
jgi:hypothetical protein